MKTELHNCYICAKGVGQSYAGSVVGGSVFVVPSRLRLANSVGFLVVS